MDPVTMSVASLAATAGGTGLAMLGAQKTGAANAATAQYQAAVARNNSIIAERNAMLSRDVGAAKADIELRKNAALIGTQRATQAANGLDVDVGSNVDVRAGTAEMGHLDALTIMSNAEREAFGYQAKAADYTAESNLDIMKMKNAKQAGDLQTMSSLISGASSFSDKWMSGYRSGVFGS